MEEQLEPLTILYCGANPIDKRNNHIDLGKECQAIRAAIHGSHRFRLYPEYATSHELLLRLLKDEQPTIVHFGLHGLREASSLPGALRDLHAELGPEAGLVLIGGDGAPVLLDPAKLRKILQICETPPRCVVMSACHSEPAARLLSQDIDHLVAMKEAISDVGAIDFSTAFYRNLASGLTFREAVEQAALVLRAPEDGYPVLFQRPGVEDQRLVPPSRRPPPDRRLENAVSLDNSDVSRRGAPFRRSWATAIALLLGFLLVVVLAAGYPPIVSLRDAFFDALDWTTSAQEEREPNDTRERATPIGVNLSVRGYMSDGADHDWFKFSTRGSYRNVIEIALTNDDWSFFPGLMVSDADGHVLLNVPDKHPVQFTLGGEPATNQLITLSARPNSTYYVQVRAHTGDGYGDYLLSLTSK